MRRFAGRADDRGAGSLEFVGVVTLAAILVIGVVGGVAAYPQAIGTAWCRFLEAAGMGGGCESLPADASGPTDADYEPEQCMLVENASTYQGEVKIAWVTLSEGSGFIVQEFSDGTVRATLVDSAGIGAEGGLGEKGEGFTLADSGDGDKLGAKVDLGGGLTFEYGSTWQFDDKSQWESMKSGLDDYLIQQETLKNDQYGGYALYLSLFNKWVDPPKDPSVTYSKMGLTAALDASVGVSTYLPANTGGAKHGQDTDDPDMGLGVSLSASADAVVGVENDADAGTTSFTFELSGEGDVSGEAILAQGGVTGKIEGALKTTYKDGVLVGIELSTAHEGGWQGSVGNDTLTPVKAGGSKSGTTSVVTTTTLEVTDANRDVAQQWLKESAAGKTLTLPFSAMVVDSPSSDPFEQLLYQEGKTSAITYHNVSDSWKFGLEVKAGWQLGFSIGAEEATATKTDASYLGAPQQDGSRPMVNFESCQ